MENDWAFKNLQTIRVLMERSAIYRRALGPIMAVAGIIGLITMGVGLAMHLNSSASFTWLWLITSVITFVTTSLLVRRQALKDSEPFWSPPARRVSQALFPNFLVGFLVAVLFLLPHRTFAIPSWILPPVWMLFYGCGLHSAGFFMPRSIKLLGWVFILGGIALLTAESFVQGLRSFPAANYMMGGAFGVLHLAFSAYLFATEQRNPNRES